MSTPDPDELLRQLDPGLAELKAKAEEAQERASSSSATKRSQDGSVAVTVGPGGNLTGLDLTERAYQRQPNQLAAQIMRLANQAQQQVSAEVLAAFTELVGPGSPALSVLTPFLPPEPTEEEEETPAANPDDPYAAPRDDYGPPPVPQGGYGQPQGNFPPQANVPPPAAGNGPPAPPPPTAPPTGEIPRRPRRTRGPDQDVEPDYDEGDLWS